MKLKSIKSKTSFRKYIPEWENQRTVWLAWPHNKKEWRGGNSLLKIQEFYMQFIDIILDFQDVKLIFPDEETLIRSLFIPSIKNKKYKLKKIVIPNNDIWIRDYGPFFMKSVWAHCSEPILVDFEFNAWGNKYPPWDLDNKVSKEISKHLGLEIESYPMVLEGGALEFSGDGVIITTESCLLNKNRNPKLNRGQIENILKSTFNIEEVIWLKQGLAGDHTDGHIDNIVRFIGPRKILLTSTNIKKDPNYKHLKESIEYLKNWKHPKKKYKFEIMEIPLAETMKYKNEILPRSYANFIFVNNGVIVPMFNCDMDKVALNIFKKLFPTKKIIGIDCSFLIKGGGGLHCITKQEPLI